MPKLNSVDVSVCRRFRLTTFWFVDVLVCPHFGLSTFWFVDVSACRRFGLSTFWFVDVSVCRRFGLSMFWFVDVSVCLRFGCRRFGLSTFWLVTTWTVVTAATNCQMPMILVIFHFLWHISTYVASDVKLTKFVILSLSMIMIYLELAKHG